MGRERRTFAAAWLSWGDQHYPHIVYRRKAELLEMLGEWDRAEAVHRGNLEWLEGHGFRHQAAVSRMNLGWILNRKGLGREGLALLEAAERTLESEGTEYDRCNVYNKLGNTCYRLGDYRQAEGHFRRSLELSVRQGDREQEANAENNLGNVYGDLGDIGRALEHYRRSYDIGERIRDVYNNAKTAGNIAWCLMAKGDHAQAMEWYQQQAFVAGACGDKHLLSVAIGNMVAIFIAEKDYPRARESVARRLKLAREMGDMRGLSVSLSHLSHIQRHEKDLEGAEASIDQAIALARKLDARYFLSMYLNEKAVLLRDAGRSVEAVSANNEALAIARDMGVAKLMAEASLLGASLAGDPAEAAALLDGLEGLALEPHQAAKVHSELFRLTGREENRARALELFRELAAGDGGEEYRKEMEKLSA